MTQHKEPTNSDVVRAWEESDLYAPNMGIVQWGAGSGRIIQKLPINAGEDFRTGLSHIEWSTREEAIKKLGENK